ncbi:hypothetical protein TNCV_1758501 [Trichonephila clavipes]|nr:hypothetical protein TNCV_1758501 [Trichonephila clavipes]
MATGSYMTPIYSRSQSEVQGDLHKLSYSNLDSDEDIRLNESDSEESEEIADLSDTPVIHSYSEVSRDRIEACLWAPTMCGQLSKWKQTSAKVSIGDL